MEAGQAAGARIKQRNTIVEKWPAALKLHPGQPGAQEEFDILVGSALSSDERYVEWKREK